MTAFIQLYAATQRVPEHAARMYSVASCRSASGVFIIFIRSPARETEIIVTTAPNARMTYAELVMSFLTSL